MRFNLREITIWFALSIFIDEDKNNSFVSHELREHRIFGNNWGGIET